VKESIVHVCMCVCVYLCMFVCVSVYACVCVKVACVVYANWGGYDKTPRGSWGNCFRPSPGIVAESLLGVIN
jgi:hypothetical protein